MVNRCSDGFRSGKRDARRSYSDYGYDRAKYERYHGTQRQHDYAAGWDEEREEMRYEKRRQEEREEAERQERRRQDELARRRQEEQWEYERQMEEQQQEQDMEIE